MSSFLASLLKLYLVWRKYKFIIIIIIIQELFQTVVYWGDKLKKKILKIGHIIRLCSRMEKYCVSVYSRVECGHFFWSVRTGQVIKVMILEVQIKNFGVKSFNPSTPETFFASNCYDFHKCCCHQTPEKELGEK